MQASIAVLSALLPRTGARSPLGMLDADTLRYIVVQAVPVRRAVFCTLDKHRINIHDAGVDGFPIIVSCLNGSTEIPRFTDVLSMRVLVEWYALVQCRTDDGGDIVYHTMYLVDFRDPLHPVVTYIQKYWNSFPLDRASAVVGRRSFFFRRRYPPQLMAVSPSSSDGDKDDVRELWNMLRGETDLTEFGCDTAVIGNREEAMLIRIGEDEPGPRFSSKRVTMCGRGKVLIARREHANSVLEVSHENGETEKVEMPSYELEYNVLEHNVAETVGLSVTEFGDSSTGLHAISVTSIYPVRRGQHPLTRFIELSRWDECQGPDVVFPDIIAVTTFQLRHGSYDFTIYWIGHDDAGGIEVTYTRQLVCGFCGKTPTMTITGLDHVERSAIACLKTPSATDGGDESAKRDYSSVHLMVIDTKTGVVMMHRSSENVSGDNNTFAVYPIGSHLNDRFT